MNDLEIRLNDFESRLKRLETAIDKIPDPFVIYYKAPGKETHEKLHLSLDDLYARINRIEESIRS